ncbi:MAG: hypothetical protein IPJ88_03870 [Myxococcales bacterium]|nr:MAG: hypothetical protein IPJ88_03870 [Myxococcales bacterium]
MKQHCFWVSFALVLSVVMVAGMGCSDEASETTLPPLTGKVQAFSNASKSWTYPALQILVQNMQSNELEVYSDGMWQAGNSTPLKVTLGDSVDSRDDRLVRTWTLKIDWAELTPNSIEFKFEAGKSASDAQSVTVSTNHAPSGLWSLSNANSQTTPCPQVTVTPVQAQLTVDLTVETDESDASAFTASFSPKIVMDAFPVRGVLAEACKPSNRKVVLRISDVSYIYSSSNSSSLDGADSSDSDDADSTDTSDTANTTDDDSATDSGDNNDSNADQGTGAPSGDPSPWSIPPYQPWNNPHKLAQASTLNNDSCTGKLGQWRGAFFAGGITALPEPCDLSQVCLLVNGQEKWLSYRVWPYDAAACGPAWSVGCERDVEP